MARTTWHVQQRERRSRFRRRDLRQRGELDGQAGFIVGRKHADNCPVHVPPDVVIAIHGGHCVRIDRARATIDKQGWETAPAYGSRM